MRLKSISQSSSSAPIDSRTSPLESELEVVVPWPKSLLSDKLLLKPLSLTHKDSATRLQRENSRISFSNTIKLFSPVIQEDVSQRSSVVKVLELDSRNLTDERWLGSMLCSPPNHVDVFVYIDSIISKLLFQI